MYLLSKMLLEDNLITVFVATTIFLTTICLKKIIITTTFFCLTTSLFELFGQYLLKNKKQKLKYSFNFLKSVNYWNQINSNK
jgi:hypothetical protein